MPVILGSEELELDHISVVSSPHIGVGMLNRLGVGRCTTAQD
jgi:hypothetical protein